MQARIKDTFLSGKNAGGRCSCGRVAPGERPESQKEILGGPHLAQGPPALLAWNVEKIKLIDGKKYLLRETVNSHTKKSYLSWP